MSSRQKTALAMNRIHQDVRSSNRYHWYGFPIIHLAKEHTTMNPAWGQYEHSPFLSVICHIQFPVILKISQELPASFQEVLRKDYPLFQPTQDRRGYRLASQEHAREILLLPDSLTVMTGRYAGWKEFRARISAAMSALQTCYEPAFCARANLRFQSLLRPVRCGLTKFQWASLINAKVLGPFSLPGQKGQLHGSRHEVIVALPDSEDRLRLIHGFVQYREAGRADQPGEPSYLLDQDYFTTQQLEWAGVFSRLDRFEQEAGRFFRLCVTNQMHQAMVPKAA
ncbi:MAG: TIGR04255 family protein [Nitrospira sp.]|nr:TIGR04255 family protein [Nitrospira sp.]